VKDLWSIGSIRECFCRGLRETRNETTLQKIKVEIKNILAVAWAQKKWQQEELKLKSAREAKLRLPLLPIVRRGRICGRRYYFFRQFIWGDYGVRSGEIPWSSWRGALRHGT